MSKKKPPDGPDLFNYVPPVKTARQAGIEAADQALDHAIEVDPEWGNDAYLWIAKYAKEHTEFIAEQVRIFAHEQGFRQPPAPGAWGPVFKKAAKGGIISNTGRYEEMQLVVTHGKPARVWASNICF